MIRHSRVQTGIGDAGAARGRSGNSHSGAQPRVCRRGIGGASATRELWGMRTGSAPGPTPIPHSPSRSSAGGTPCKHAGGTPSQHHPHPAAAEASGRQAGTGRAPSTSPTPRSEVSHSRRDHSHSSAATPPVLTAAGQKLRGRREGAQAEAARPARSAPAAPPPAALTPAPAPEALSHRPGPARPLSPPPERRRRGPGALRSAAPRGGRAARGWRPPWRPTGCPDYRGRALRGAEARNRGKITSFRPVAISTATVPGGFSNRPEISLSPALSASREKCELLRGFLTLWQLGVTQGDNRKM